MEIEELDAVGKDNEEEEGKRNVGYSNFSQEAIFKPHLLLEKTVLSIATTGCTELVLVAPRKITAEYMAPRRFNRFKVLEKFKTDEEVVDLRFTSLVPKYKSKHDTNNYCHEESDNIVLWISPVGPMLFPEAGFALSHEGLGIFGGKVKVLCSRLWVIAVSDLRNSWNSLQKTTVRPVSTVFRTVRITIAAARASRPDVGSSIKIMEGLATNSTAMVNLFLCSVDKPSIPGRPTRKFLIGCESIEEDMS
ncbi:Coatomer subunit beta-1 [Senna tora]|uniref:Coatomer subunit beta-1 n=1 Tax=Senna tora TaxID=362788 RepID=A0A834TDN9_9FABA|nr:Coatomer subunit beta-1 [Senna tora]